MFIRINLADLENKVVYNRPLLDHLDIFLFNNENFRKVKVQGFKPKNKYDRWIWYEMFDYGNWDLSEVMQFFVRTQNSLESDDSVRSEIYKDLSDYYSKAGPVSESNPLFPKAIRQTKLTSNLPMKKLVVLEAKIQDVGRGIIRIDPATMELMGIRTGEAIQVISNKGRRTVGLSWYGFPQDRERGVIRLDPATRRNAQIKLGETVVIQEIDVKDAQEIIFSTTEVLHIQGGESYLRNRLNGRIFTKGDYLELVVMGRTILLNVHSYNPPRAEAVIVNLNTQITISDTLLKEFPQHIVPRISYEDIGGLHDAFQKLREMIELPLEHPVLFERLGVEAPKGVLLHGPPGTGKTLLVKAFVNETDFNMIFINGLDIKSKFYGKNEEIFYEIFEDAKKNAPCIILIDEIDAIASKPEDDTDEVKQNMVAKLLTALDRLDSREQIVIIGVTNIPNNIDPALRQRGRIDREIEIEISNRHSRLEILQFHTRSMPLEYDVDLNELASTTHGLVRADLVMLVKEAALLSLREIIPKINIDEDIPFEILERININRGHFDRALLKVRKR